MKKPSEYDHQCAVFKWAAYSQAKYPCLKYLNASINGLKLGIGQAVKAKRSGMKKGVPDLHLPLRNSEYTSLYIELKIHPNIPSKEQFEWMSWLTSQGAKCKVCYSAKEAVNEIETYMRIL